MLFRIASAFFASSSIIASRSARARRSLFILAVRREVSSGNLLISLTAVSAGGRSGALARTVLSGTL